MCRHPAEPSRYAGKITRHPLLKRERVPKGTRILNQYPILFQYWVYSYHQSPVSKQDPLLKEDRGPVSIREGIRYRISTGLSDGFEETPNSFEETSECFEETQLDVLRRRRLF